MEDKHLNVKAVNKTHPKGKEAISHYTVVSSDEETSSIDVMIETGRRHQIRMAMQHLGTPVVGDERHGAITNPYKRVMLHASALEFLHPETDDPVRFEAPLPASFPRS
jgi:23S rRNA pseudouridine1911/1915/1917 synthase